jgi:hypothetical protein
VTFPNHDFAYWAGGECEPPFIASIDKARIYPSMAAAYERALWLKDTRSPEICEAAPRPLGIAS